MKKNYFDIFEFSLAFKKKTQQIINVFIYLFG